MALWNRERPQSRHPNGCREMKSWKPMFIENSRIPVWLSKISPIEIGAISLMGFVFSRGYMSPVPKRHETVHFQQQLEMAFIFFFLFYLSFWLIGLVKYRSGVKSYRENPFEREAYSNECNKDYLTERKRYSWIKYL